MAPTQTAPALASWSTNEFSETPMKPIFDTLKHVLGLKTGKPVEFDAAMTLILKAGGDSQLYLDGENHGDAEVLCGNKPTVSSRLAPACSEPAS